MKQQEVLDAFYDELLDIVGDDLVADADGNKIYPNMAIDNKPMPLVVFFVVDDQDTYLLGDGRINNTNIQVSFFGKKDDTIRDIRAISDKFVEEIDGKVLSNGLTVMVTNKGFTTISDVNDQTVQIVTEYNIS